MIKKIAVYTQEHPLKKSKNKLAKDILLDSPERNSVYKYEI